MPNTPSSWSAEVTDIIGEYGRSVIKGNFSKDRVDQSLTAIREANKKWVVGESENETIDKVPGLPTTDRIARWRNQLREEQRKRLYE